ncbi:hypothetical protein DCS_02854 [Drechmeria coniospora]|uniref:Uncharacterized protein n=1 Tax=Drechmeria coniospora TaxID=98403 RepID=A0A151GXB5_DRECN|nr:hypothetical protein DCS_02854 [Drechmeria coniospora]KYK61711.1 hypothetical protein DCS_02854 [Drechmeria coniospora]
MMFSVSTLLMASAACAVAQQQQAPPPPPAGVDGPQDGPFGGPHHGRGPHHGPPTWLMEKVLVCPAAGGLATVDLPCPPAKPKHNENDKPKHPHVRPAGAPEWDGTITIFPSGAPEVTVTASIDCKGCASVTVSKPTSCTNMPPRRPHHERPGFGNPGLPVVTAPAGATKTVYFKGPPVCKPTPA